MDLSRRISAFNELGRRLPDLLTDTLFDEVNRANPWFTREETGRAVSTWARLLTTKNLLEWTNAYDLSIAGSNGILVVSAGNIPLAGFHDFLSVLISGNRFTGRLSSRDDILLQRISGELAKIDPLLGSHIDFNHSGTAPDAVIATGSNNTARYFRSRYAGLPHIIRKNRSSAAVLDGTETPAELAALASDILDYHGLGCRSVSHVYMPAGETTGTLAGALVSRSKDGHCQPMADNLQYQRARLQMLNVPFTDTGGMLLVEEENLHSPIGIVHISHYHNREELLESLAHRAGEIQCLTGHKSLAPGLIPFGTAQSPALGDYADNIDTLDFLAGLGQGPYKVKH
jgi:hypothetical protein